MNNNEPIETLEIRVTSDTESAVSGLSNLTKSLEKIKSISGRISLKSYTTAINNIATSAGKISGSSVGNLGKLADVLNKLSGVGKLQLSPSVATKITAIGDSVAKLSNQDFSGAEKLATALMPLSAIGSMSNLASATKSLQSLPSALSGLNNIDSSGAERVVEVLKPLEQLQQSNLGSTLSQLRQLPKVLEQINSIPVGQLDIFNKRIQILVKYLKPLATEMDKISQGFAKLPAKIQQAITATNRYSKSVQDASFKTKLFTAVSKRLQATLSFVRKYFMFAARAVADMFTSASDYVESLNLFTVSMGEVSDEAKRFADRVQELMGIDAAEWMQYQGTFQNLITGFDISSDKANIMSKNLTQLSYDLSSFFNTDAETAFDKLSSAMAGQVKGLREFGINTTAASLQEYALSKGIELSVSKMTQAQKTMLRYNYIMEKSINMQGDMARTIITPSNSLRILKAQWQIMIRTMGQFVSVIAVKVIPIVQALVQVLTTLAQRLASFFGYELPEIDYSGLSVGGAYADDLGDNLDDATASAKKLQKTLLGMDEINKLNDNSSGSGGVDSGGYGSDLGLEPISYDFLGNLEKIDLSPIIDKLKDVLWYAGAIAGALAAWRIGKFLNELGLLPGGLATALGAALAVGGIILEIKGIKFQWEEGLDLQSLIETLGGAGLITTGGALIGKGFGSAFMGAGIGMVVGGVPAFVAALHDALENGLNGLNITELLAGAGLSVGGAAMIGSKFGSSLIGALVGAAILGIATYAIGIWDAIQNGLDWISGLLIPAGATGAGAAIGAIIGMLGGPIGAGIGALIGLAVGLVTDLVILIVQNWEAITAWCSQACTDIGQFFVNLWNGIVDIWNTVADWFNETVITPVADFFSGLWEGISSAASTCWNAIVEFFSPAVEWFSELFGSIWQTISDIFYNIGVIASGCWEIIKKVWSIVSEWFNKNVIQPVGNFFSGLWNGVKDFAISAWEGIKSVFSTIGNWIYSKVIKPVGDFFTGLWNGFLDKAKAAWEGVKSVFSAVGKFFGDTFKAAWEKVVKVFSIAGEIFVDIKNGIVSAFKKVVNGIITGINKVVSVPFNGINSALQWLRDIEILGLTPFSGIRTISVPQIPLLASGGQVDAGQMFVARESGPELVGSIGHKTTVANNEQIIDGISEGVADANSEQNALLREQNMLLRKILEKDNGGNGGSTGGAIYEIQRKNRRDGKTIIPVGV